MSIHKAAWAEVHVDDLYGNLDIVRSRLQKDTAVCAVLKADAYGHGMAGVLKNLSKDHRIQMAAVGKMSELLHLTEDTPGDRMPVLLLGASEADELGKYLEENRINLKRSVFSVYSMRQFRDLNRLGARFSVQIQVHLRVDGWDSGMGLGYQELLSAEKELFAAENLIVSGLYSHLYSSYSENTEMIRQELESFDAFVCRIRPEHRRRLTVHILNSALIFRFPQYAYDMVRTGTALYGLPCNDGGVLRPVMRICAQVFDVREIDSSAPLSYHIAPEQGGTKRIARIMLGYWDSPFLLTQKDIRIRIRGKLFVPADDVCMDNLCIDVTGADDIRAGDEAVLLGEEGVTVGEVLERNGVHYVHSEWLCMTAGRLEKVYV